MSFWLWTLLHFVVWSQAQAYNLLVLMPIGSRSTYSIFKALSESLGNAGHSVTFISSFNASSKNENVREVHTSDYSIYQNEMNMFEVKSLAEMGDWIQQGSQITMDRMYGNPKIINIWNRRREFDAIIIMGYVNEVAVPFLMDYDKPIIGVCTPGVEYVQMAMHGNWLPLSIVPHLILPYDEYMSFSERTLNFAFHFYFYLYHRWNIAPFCQNLISKYFPNCSDYLSLYENRTLTFINGNYAMDNNIPLLHNQVEIGTLTAKKPSPLPTDLEEFVNGSGEHGVIYFSLGSIGKATYMPQKYKEIILTVFRQIPQRVLWKYEGDDLDLPANVMTKTWMPQQDILGHSKTKLFMSHCGNLGTQEAKYHGVPILALPVSIDQPRNAARLASKGLAIVINWEEMTEKNLLDAINTLIGDPSYQKRMMLISNALKDLKETPQELVVWWTEYVIRHHGEPHLMYAGKRLNMFQYFMFDILAFWILIFAVFSYLFYLIIKCAIKNIMFNKQTVKEKKS